jgi:Fe-S-cluster-containing hydrogenase component 2/CRP-like cAMP-binding protein
LTIDFYGELAEQVDYELDACIGCHLCMRACPLPDAKVIQISELNDAAAGGPLSERVLRFTLDCTQCGACVPVCPADISRMRMVFATKLRLDPPPEDAAVYVQAGDSIQPSGWTQGSLAVQLTRLPLFAGVSSAELRSFIPRITLQRHPAGAELLREGKYSNELRVILNGAANMSVQGLGGEQIPVFKLAPGHLFGEFGVLSDRPNPTTVTASSDITVLVASAAALQRLSAESAAFAERLEAMHARYELSAYLQSVLLLQDLPQDVVERLGAQLNVRTYERGAIIARENAAAEVVHFVLNGFVKVSHAGADDRERIITYVHDRGVFVDWTAVSRGRYSATLTANTRCEIVGVGRGEINSLRASYASFRERFDTMAREHAQLLARMLGPEPPPGAEHLAGLLDGGVLQSHSLLVIDERLCIDCNNCVDACVRRHGHPRLERHGLTVGPYLIATACRQCDDPLCLLCPVDGIVRNADGTIVINNNCIGCGACAERCPYDNIRMADVQQMVAAERAEDGLWNRLRNFAKPRQHGAVTFDQDDLRPKIAVKCDLCAGHKDGPACVRNCPTSAIFRADGARFFGSGEMIALTATASRPRRR